MMMTMEAALATAAAELSSDAAVSTAPCAAVQRASTASIQRMDAKLPLRG